MQEAADMPCCQTAGLRADEMDRVMVTSLAQHEWLLLCISDQSYLVNRGGKVERMDAQCLLNSRFMFIPFKMTNPD